MTPRFQKVHTTGYQASCIIPTVPVEPVVAGLLRPLVQDSHALPGQCEYF